MSDGVPSRLSAALADRYRIERELGAGGMATVYLAADLKHDRKVALKVLKPELAAVVGAERFLAEIRTTANLQHPNILPLFDSGEAGGLLFFVMPYVEGETLADRLQREKQLPVEEAVRIATAVANALQAAHEKGVIHRDIKPANILLSRGQPLVADFGIALAVGAAGGNRLTETGLSVGTPFYMSPEQATGDQTVGPSTDVYALGCVLYEMLVGEPPFVGNTAQAVLGKILQGEAAPVTASRKAVPANVDAAVRKALERLPADRFSDAEGFARALGDPSFRYGEPVGTRAGAAGGPWKIASLAAAVVVVSAVGVAGWALSREPASAYPPMNVVVGIPDDEAFTGYASFDLSPDGSFIVYQGPAQEEGSQLWVRRLSELRGEPIPGTRNGVLPSIAPDGADVVFQGAGFPVRNLQVASLTGGGVRTVADSAWCCPAWGEDGWIYYTGVDKALMRVPAAGGDPEVVVPSRPGKTTWEPRLGPGGDWVIQNVGGDGPTRIQVVDLASGDTAVVPGGISPVPAPWGDLVYMTQDRRLLSVPFDPSTRRVASASLVLATELYDSGDEVGHFALSGDGQVLAYRRRGESAAAWAAYWLEDGAPQPVDPGWSADVDGAGGGVAISPEGDRVAFAVRIEGQSEIFVKRLPAGAEVRLSASDAWDGLPAWTPDGRYVTFLSDRSGAAQLYRRRADGGGTTELFLEDPRGLAQATWSPGGDWLVYRTNRFQAGSGDILAIRPGVDSVPRTLAGSQFTEEDPDISPDGRWMAYASNETGRSEVFVVPFPDTDGPRIPVSSRGGFWPRWSHDGRSLYYVALDGRGLLRADLELEPPYPHQETVVMDEAGLEGWGAAESAPYAVDPASGRLMGLLSAGADVETELVVVQGVADRVRAAREGGAP